MRHRSEIAWNWADPGRNGKSADTAALGSEWNESGDPCRWSWNKAAGGDGVPSKTKFAQNGVLGRCPDQPVDGRRPKRNGGGFFQRWPFRSPRRHHGECRPSVDEPTVDPPGSRRPNRFSNFCRVSPVIGEDLEQIMSAGLSWDALAGRTVLVSGAAGFLPAYMVETMLHLNRQIGLGVRVIGLVRNLERAQARFADYDGRPDLQICRHDISQPVDAIGTGFDVIIHAASQASPTFFETDPVGTLNANVLGTHHLLNRAITDATESFLYLSSGEVYGATETVPTPEDAYGYLDPLTVRSCYAESKRMAETMAVSYHHQHGVPVSIVRPFHTYGPGVRLDDGRVFADFVDDVFHNRPIVMKSDGSARRAFCYLADATIGFFTVLLNGERGQAYNVGNEDAEYSILELAHALGAQFDLAVVEKPRSTGSAYAVSSISRSAPNTAKLRALGWTPTTGVLEGFRRTVASMAQPTH